MYKYSFVAVRLLNRQRAGKGPRRQYRYLGWPPWSDAATYSFGRPIANRSASVHTPIIYTAILFRQVMPRLMSPRVSMRALHKGARGCAARDTRMYTMHRAWSRSHDARPQDEEQHPRKGQRRSRCTARRGSLPPLENAVKIGRSGLDYVG